MKKTTFIEKWLTPMNKQNVPEIESAYQVRFIRNMSAIYLEPK